MSRTQRPSRELPRGCKGNAPHSVEAWAVRLGGTQKVQNEDWSQFTPLMLERCQADVEIQHKIYEFLLEEGKNENWENAHRLNAKLFHYLQRQEEYGWRCDLPHMDRCFHFLCRWIDRIDAAVTPRLPLVVEVEEPKKNGEWNYVKKPFRLDGSLSEQVKRYFGSESLDVVSGPFSRIGFRPVNLNSNAEVKDFLLSLGWQPQEFNTNDKGERTSPKFSKDDPFEGIQGSLGKLIARRIQCRQRQSVLEGWRESLRPDGRISPRVAGIASTGRLRHAGIVNVPSPASGAFFARWMRELFTAREDWVLVGTDSKGNQMRQLAARMNDPEFTKAVLYGNSKDGTDLHSLNQKRAGLSNRTLAKNFFYGCILFGAGDRKTAKLLQSTPEKAKELKQNYFREMPKLRELLDREIAAWRKTAQQWFNKKYNRIEYKNGYIRGLDGRPILVEFEKDILVFYLQSDEAIHMSAAYCLAHKKLEKKYRYGDDYAFVIFYHDEFVVECRKEIAQDVAQICSDAIKQAGEFYKIACPHAGDPKIGANWAEVH